MSISKTWGASTVFTAPTGWREYKANIYQRSLRLIDLHIWEGISAQQLDRWLKNFVTDEEQYFSAAILDGLIYRSEAQTEALMHDLFLRRLPQLLGPAKLHLLESLWQEDELSSDQSAVIVPVISPDQPPTKSGPILARQYRRRLGLEQTKMAWPWKLLEPDNLPNLVIFIDDFLATGNQFEGFANKFKLPMLFAKGTSTTWVYAPLVAHAKGIEKITLRYPCLGVTASEFLNDTASIFSPSHSIFADQTNTLSGVKKFYENLIARSGLDVPHKHHRGYYDMGLIYAFSHATPDNSLPILRKKSRNWIPLLEP